VVSLGMVWNRWAGEREALSVSLLPSGRDGNANHLINQTLVASKEKNKETKMRRANEEKK
jgi:hypothetical protein